MIRSVFLVLAVALAAPCASNATKLHESLPAGSTERNGEPVPIVEHRSRHELPAALPERGLHPDAAVGLARTYSGAPIDVTTYQYDPWRTGWNRQETDLTPANVASGAFGQLTTLNVDGEVLAEPLIVSKLFMPDGQLHNVLLVVTAHNSVYAFDAQTYATLWTVNLGTSQSSNDVGCGDVVPEYGISSTPVIVRTGAKAALYLVAATEPAPFSFHTQLHVLDLRTGQDLVGPVEIAPKARVTGGKTISFDPQSQWNRAGLVYANQSIYVAFGSHCDLQANRTSGWIMRYHQAGLTLGAFNTIQAVASSELASVWMSGFAPSVDRKGNILLVTGNGAFSAVAGGRNYGQSVLSLSPDLKRVNSSFTPANWATLNRSDLDLGSAGVTLIPIAAGQKAPPLAVVMGKSPTIFLMNQDKLGGLQGTDAGPLQAVGMPGNGLWGGPAYYQTDKDSRVLLQSGNDVLRAFTIQDAATPTLTQVAAGTSPAGFSGTIPTVSSHGRTAGTGVAWIVRRGLSEQLEAYDAETLGVPLFSANAGTWGGSNGGRAFVAPLVANGRVYVGGNKTVTVFGLTD